MLIRITLEPGAPAVLCPPRADRAAGSLRDPEPRIGSRGGVARIDKEEEGGAPWLVHTARHRDRRPVPAPIHALNDHVHLVPVHDEMVAIVGVNDRGVE